MEFLKEIVNLNTLRLNETQKGALAVIFNSPTPTIAFNTLTGSMNIESALDSLEKVGLIKKDSDQIILTNRGRQMVTNLNIEENGELTETGENLIKDTVKNKNNWNINESDKFSVLKTIS